jgi:hypothetical protein
MLALADVSLEAPWRSEVSRLKRPMRSERIPDIVVSFCRL